MAWLLLSVCVIVSVTVNRISGEGCTGFHYDGPDGQESWYKHYENCSGKHQSPIDIDSVFVKMVVLSPLQMNGFNSTAGTAKLTNNGHTAMMIIDTPNQPTISGGPLLNSEYVFAQLHFHWGSDDTCGSEDKIDGKSFPLELHIVFYKKEYQCVDKALGFYDGLTVLACVFEVTDRVNLNYEPFVQMLSKVIEPGQIAVFPKVPALYDLLPNDLTQYFTYHGSLTTPPCAEAVTWIDFKEPIKIKSSQLEAFRKLINDEAHPLVNNFRAVQPIGDRIVLRNIGNKRNTNRDNNNNINRNVKSSTNILNNILQDVLNIPKPPPSKKKTKS